MAVSQTMTSSTPMAGSGSILSLPATRISWKWWALWLTGFGVLSMMIPRDASYDVVHYHLHNGWSVLNGRGDTDLAPAELHTYLNPTWQVLIWSLIDLLPGRAVAFLLGAMQGLLLPALYTITRRLLTKSGVQPHALTVIAIAVAGFFAEAQFGLFGSVRNDALCALAFLASLILILPEERAVPAFRAIALASLLMGAITGLKLTNMVYVAGFASALLVLLPDWRLRLQGAALAGATGLAGIIMFGGPWAWHLYSEFGNPIFPMMNTVFDAPLGPDTAFRDTKFLPSSFVDGVFRPFAFLIDAELIHEHDYFDLRFLMGYLGALALLATAWVKRADLPPQLLRTLAAFAAAFIGVFTIWSIAFSIGRYVIALWMLGPVFVAVLLANWKPDWFSNRLAPHVSLGACALLFVSTQPAELRRAHWQSWAEPYYSASIPNAAKYEGATIIFSGRYPSAALATGFPASATFTHAVPVQWSAPALDNYRPVIREHWRQNADRLFVIILDTENHFAKTIGRLQDEESLRVEPQTCQPIDTSFDAPQMKWMICPAELQKSF